MKPLLRGVRYSSRSLFRLAAPFSSSGGFPFSNRPDLRFFAPEGVSCRVLPLDRSRFLRAGCCVLTSLSRSMHDCFLISLAGETSPRGGLLCLFPSPKESVLFSAGASLSASPFSLPEKAFLRWSVFFFFLERILFFSRSSSFCRSVFFPRLFAVNQSGFFFSPL